MAETYIASTLVEDGVASTDAFATLGSINQPFIQEGAILGIFNDVDSGKVVTIKKIEIVEHTTQTSTTNLLTLNRGTANPGGETVPVIAMDSTTSLPSQVVCNRYGGDPTISGTTLRKIMVFPSVAKTGLKELAGRANGRANGSDPSSALSHSHVYANNFSEVQSYVLREGQSFYVGSSTYDAYAIPLEISLWVTDGTNGFIVRTVVSPTNQNGGSLFSIYNGSGSGVVLNITRVEVREITDYVTSAGTNLSIETISGMTDGHSVTPTPLDSTNTLSDATIRIKKNPGVLRQGPDAQYNNNPGVGDLPVRKIPTPYYGQGLTRTTGLLRPDVKRSVVFDFSTQIDTEGGFVLREGEGLAIFRRALMYMIGNYQYIITYTVSGGASAVYPAEDDVEAGVTYGPSGTDFTGTVTLPDQTDVLTGVQYGADGTEFTGTATGGGGGGESSSVFG